MNTNSKMQQSDNVKKLPVKYERYIVFCHWISQMLKSNEVNFEDMTHVFDNVKGQMEFIDTFLEDYKIISKSYKKEMRDRCKLSKPIKVKPETEKKKRGRKKKEKVDTRTEEEKLMDEIIAKAQLEYNEDDNNGEVEVRENDPIKKKRGRPRKEKKIVSVTGDDLIGMLISQNSRNDEVEEDIENSDEDSEAEEINVVKFINNDVLYLIDDNDNIYDVDSHEPVGKWNKTTTSIDFTEV